jgi:hypothetical protein
MRKIERAHEVLLRDDGRGVFILAVGVYIDPSWNDRLTAKLDGTLGAGCVTAADAGDAAAAHEQVCRFENFVAA